MNFSEKMFRRFIDFLLVTLFVSGIVLVVFTIQLVIEQQQSKKPARLLPMHHSIVRLHDAATGELFCSATVILPRLAITAAHCLKHVVEGPVQIPIVVVDADRSFVIPVTNVKYDAQVDIGAVFGDFTSIEPAQYSHSPESTLKFFETSKAIQLCGFPLSGALYCNTAAPNYMMPYRFSIALHAFLYPGMSGGPVVDEETNTVIGVNSGVTGSTALVAPLINAMASMGINFEDTQ